MAVVTVIRSGIHSEYLDVREAFGRSAAVIGSRPAVRKTLAHAGFGEAFARMWQLYLAYAEASFRSGYLNVCQWSFVSEAVP
jgi:cyclopropane fatty-acyl-phospholipid synthase-like methyltransferase